MTDAVKTPRFSRRLRAGTALALVALFAGSGVAMAQTAAPADAKPAAQPANDTVVVITGARVSQRSSIERKKNAKTATDSITAEDVGAFPDKNVNEAISRVPGVALDRGDFGEGQGISIRGQSPENTRVDLDGMSVLNTNGGLTGGAGSATGGRSSDMRELPSDLIKSVDVIKGSTAATTEGSLAGAVHIETRTGLDFKKPYFSFRADGQMNTVGKKWTPDYNMIAARKFFGGRLGVIGNLTYSEIQNNSDSEQPQTSGNAGPSRNADIDQSPNKTFTYNPSVVDPSATAANVSMPGYSSASPIDILKKSAAAQTQADCKTAFAPLTQAQLDAIGAGTNVVSGTTNNGVSASANKTAAQLEQTNELQTCLNQWNDYVPSLIRFISRDYFERRFSADIRFDYKVNDEWQVYIKGSVANRISRNVDNTLNLGNAGYNVANTFTQATVPATSNALLIPRVPNAGFTAYPDGVGGSVISDITNATVDDTHHVTAFNLTDGNVNVDAVLTQQRIESHYVQAGARYRSGPVKLDFMVGDSGSTFQRGQYRSALNYTYGNVGLHVTDAGLWTYDLPQGLDLYNAAAYAAVKPGTVNLAAVSANSNGQIPAVGAYTIAQQAQFSNNFTLTWRPVESDDSEKQLKLDLTYDFENKLPFFSDIQGGIQTRNHTGNGWSGGGYVVKPGVGAIGAAGYVAPVVVPTNNLTTNYRSCVSTSTSTQPCVYGYAAGTSLVNNIPVSNLSATLQGTQTFTPTQLQDLVTASLYVKKNPFLGDYPDRGDVMQYYPELNMNTILDAVPHDGFNFDCMKTCKANDGNVYEQPHFAYHENTQAMYLMTDFDQKLPWGMDFNGNFGTRMIKTTTQATGFMTFNHISKTSAFDPANPTASTGIATTTISINTSLNNQTTDWTPSYNLNLWAIPDKVVLRYYSGHVISRPTPGALLPSGTCNIDDRTYATDNSADSVDQTCSGRVGNPGLKPYKAINHNESIEWYPNKDIMVSLGYYYNNVLTGAPMNANISSGYLFAGSSQTDPVTGQPIANQSFTYPSYVNGPGGLQRGIEFSTKIAFTFLPWFLKYTGTDFNYSKLGFKNAALAQDLLSGAYLPPIQQSGYFQNWSIWYDDGKLNARIAYQARGDYYDFISSCSNAINNFPTAFPQCSGQTIRTPYNPGGTNYRDKTAFIDAKLNYKITKNIELFVEGRNLARALTYRETMPNNTFSDGTPTVENMAYGGARYMVGFTYRN